MTQPGQAFECMSIPIEIKKEPIVNEHNEPVIGLDGNQEYKAGFKIGGGIDQDHTKSPQNYPDNGIYVTHVHADGPAAVTDLKVHDKILQVNGYDFTYITHKKAVEYIKRGKVLYMLVDRGFGYSIC